MRSTSGVTTFRLGVSLICSVALIVVCGCSNFHNGFSNRLHPGDTDALAERHSDPGRTSALDDLFQIPEDWQNVDANSLVHEPSDRIPVARQQPDSLNPLAPEEFVTNAESPVGSGLEPFGGPEFRPSGLLSPMPLRSGAEVAELSGHAEAVADTEQPVQVEPAPELVAQPITPLAMPVEPRLEEAEEMSGSENDLTAAAEMTTETDDASAESTGNIIILRASPDSLQQAVAVESGGEEGGVESGNAVSSIPSVESSAEVTASGGQTQRVEQVADRGQSNLAPIDMPAIARQIEVADPPVEVADPPVEVADMSEVADRSERQGVTSRRRVLVEPQGPETRELEIELPVAPVATQPQVQRQTRPAQPQSQSSGGAFVLGAGGQQVSPQSPSASPMVTTDFGTTCGICNASIPAESAHQRLCEHCQNRLHADEAVGPTGIKPVPGLMDTMTEESEPVVRDQVAGRADATTQNNISIDPAISEAVSRPSLTLDDELRAAIEETLDAVTVAAEINAIDGTIEATQPFAEAAEALPSLHEITELNPARPADDIPDADDNAAPAVPSGGSFPVGGGNFSGGSFGGQFPPAAPLQRPAAPESPVEATPAPASPFSGGFVPPLPANESTPNRDCLESACETAADCNPSCTEGSCLQSCPTTAATDPGVSCGNCEQACEETCAPECESEEQCAEGTCPDATAPGGLFRIRVEPSEQPDAQDIDSAPMTDGPSASEEIRNDPALMLAGHSVDVAPVLQINNPALCSSIRGFGDIDKFESLEFKPGDQALIYCELQNYSSRFFADLSGEGYRTLLKSHFRLVDQNGNVAQFENFPLVEDISIEPRENFYIYLPMTIGALSDGEFELEVFITDVETAQTAKAVQTLSVHSR
ncbi:MAG: hypothetical protein AAF456_03880 [Planctomycetota bacterium]